MPAAGVLHARRKCAIATRGAQRPSQGGGGGNGVPGRGELARPGNHPAAEARAARLLYGFFPSFCAVA